MLYKLRELRNLLLQYLHLQCAHGQPLESNLRRGRSLGGERWYDRTKGRYK